MDGWTGARGSVNNKALFIKIKNSTVDSVDGQSTQSQSTNTFISDGFLL